MKKTLSWLFLSLFLLTSLASCRKEDKATTRVLAMKGPTAMGLVRMMEEYKEDEAYQFSLASAVDEIGPALLTDKVDIALIPANMASILYNKSQGQIEVLNINTGGVLYIVERGNRILSVEDLKGKTLYASGKGASPEYALNYILEGHGIDPLKDLKIEWKSEHAECVEAVATDPDGLALLPQPFVTVAQSKVKDLRLALDLAEEWDKLNTSSALLTGVTVVRKDFAKAHPEAVKNFMKAYEASVAFTKDSPEEAAKLIGSYDIVPEAVALKALPYCKISFITGQDLKDTLKGYLEILYKADPKAVGGALPGDDFYY